MTTLQEVSTHYKAQRDELLEFIRSAPVTSGVCCCGNDMAQGGCDGHTPLDMWDYQVRLMLQAILDSDAAR